LNLIPVCSVLDLDPIRLRTQGFDDEKIQRKIFFIKFAIYLFLGLQGHPSYKRSLQPLKENIQHFKKCNFLTFSNCCGSFLPSWIRIRIANPDTKPETPLDPIRIRIHNTACMQAGGRKKEGHPVSPD
jgi:hypothetical protein